MRYSSSDPRYFSHGDCIDYQPLFFLEHKRFSWSVMTSDCILIPSVTMVAYSLLNTADDLGPALHFCLPMQIRVCILLAYVDACVCILLAYVDTCVYFCLPLQISVCFPICIRQGTTFPTLLYYKTKLQARREECRQCKQKEKHKRAVSMHYLNDTHPKFGKNAGVMPFHLCGSSRYNYGRLFMQALAVSELAFSWESRDSCCYAQIVVEVSSSSYRSHHLRDGQCSEIRFVHYFITIPAGTRRAWDVHIRQLAKLCPNEAFYVVIQICPS